MSPVPSARRALASVLAASLSLVACTADVGSDDALTVFAAASLRDVLPDLAAAWTATERGTQVVVAYDGSNVLAAQIAEGAPADVLVAADLEQPQRLVEAGHASGEVHPFARVAITLVVPVGGDRVQRAADLAEPGVRLVTAGPGVPISRYAAEAVAQLAASMADPDGFTAAVEANVVTREDNVRAALAKVELGEGDAAFVYRSDALGNPRVRPIELDGVDVVAEYGAVAVSDHPAAADFVAWLTGSQASAILEAAGFGAARP